MCSTPKGSGSSCQVKRFVDDAADYESYSQMMRRASDRFEQRQRELEAQRKRREEAGKGAAARPERVGAMRQRPSGGSLVSRLLNFLK